MKSDENFENSLFHSSTSLWHFDMKLLKELKQRKQRWNSDRKLKKKKNSVCKLTFFTWCVWTGINDFMGYLLSLSFLCNIKLPHGKENQSIVNII